MRLTMAKLACCKGVSKTAGKSESKLEHTILISTVQTISNVYTQNAHSAQNVVVKIPYAECSRPLLLGKDLDYRAADYSKAIQ